MRIVLLALAAAAAAALLIHIFLSSRETFSPQDVKDLAAMVSAMRSSGKADEKEDGAGEDDGLDPKRNEASRDPEEPDEIDEKYGTVALALRSSKREAFDRLLAHYDSAEAFDVDKLEADMMPSCVSGAVTA